MYVILAYAIATAVLIIEGQLSGRMFERIADQAVNADWPMNIAPRLRRVTVAGGLASGLLCGLVFVFVGQSKPMLHGTVFATSNLVVLLALSWLTRHDSATGSLTAGTNVLPEWLELASATLPFALALLVSAKVALECLALY